MLLMLFRLACAAIGVDGDSIEVVDDVLEISMGGFTGMLRSEVYTPSVLAAIEQSTIFFRPPGVQMILITF